MCKYNYEYNLFNLIHFYTKYIYIHVLVSLFDMYICLYNKITIQDKFCISEENPYFLNLCDINVSLSRHHCSDL